MKNRLFALTKTCAALTALWASLGFAADPSSGTQHHGHSMAPTPTRIDKTVKIEMQDSMRFLPATVRVKAGESVRFVVTNSGKLRHEIVFGNPKDLAEHQEAMKKSPGMVHADPNMLTLDPGASGTLVRTFAQTENIEFACLQPGHYDAGMKGAVQVLGGGAAKGLTAPDPHHMH